MIPSNYKVIRELGRGAAGVVSLVRRRTDSRLFAAKQIFFAPSDTTNSALITERNRVLKEVQVLQHLPHHPSIVALEEVLESRDGVVLIMEYVDGGSLYDMVYPAQTVVPSAKQSLYSPREEPSTDWAASTWGDAPGNATSSMGLQGLDPIPEERILQWLFQLGNAIAFLHSQGVMHRDLKLSNVLITSTSQIVKIADFGVAEHFAANGRERMATTTVGTPQYFSPELCEGKPYNSKADVWALGVLAYEMCCRRPPFHAVNILALSEAIIQDSPSRIDPVYSDALDYLIQTMLTKDPVARPAADGVVARIKLVRQGASVENVAALDKKVTAAAAVAAPKSAETPEDARRQAFLEARAAAERNRQRARAERSPSPPPARAAEDLRQSPLPVEAEHVDPAAVRTAAAAAPDHHHVVEAKLDFAELREIEARNRAKLDLAFPDTPRVESAPPNVQRPVPLDDKASPTNATLAVVVHEAKVTQTSAVPVTSAVTQTEAPTPVLQHVAVQARANTVETKEGTTQTDAEVVSTGCACLVM